MQIEGEIRTREYSQKVFIGKKAADVTKSVTEVRVISIIKLDRRAKAESAPELQGATA